MEPKFVIVESSFGKFRKVVRFYAIPTQQLTPDHDLAVGGLLPIMVNRSFNVDTVIVQLLDYLPSQSLVVLHRDEFGKEKDRPNFSSQNFLATYVRSR